jgi:hypothetical protein
MKRAIPAWAFAALAALIVTMAGCAVTDEQGGAGGGAYAPKAQDPARLGLPPAYRAFYDALEDDGDWTLIEPYGYCFRPRVNFVAWRPYQDGYWLDSEYYGWIWNSNEPFGWITYHYGSWFYDEYQGWVWQPGPTWGPAWVAWVQADDYLGWAPLAPASYNDFDHVPDGVFTYAPVTQFASRNVNQGATFVAHMPSVVHEYRQILNVGHVNGVAFNRGPDPLLIQRAIGGPPERADETTLERVKLSGPAPRLTESDLQDRAARIFGAGRTQLKRMIESGVAPPAAGSGHIAPPPVHPWPATPPRVKPRPQTSPGSSPRVEPRVPRAPRAPRDSTAAPDSVGKPRESKRPPSEDRRPHAPGMEPDTTRNG